MVRFSKKISVYLLLLSLLIPGLAFAKIKVKLGIYQNPPLVFYDKEKKPAGIFPEIINHIAKEEKWDIEYVPCLWKQCLDMLQKGKIDALSAIAYSEDRARKFLFSDENVIVNWAVLYRNTDTKIEDITDLNGKKVALLENDIFYKPFLKLINSFQIDCNIKFKNSYQDIFKAISTREVDAGVVNRLFGETNINHYTKIKKTPIIYSPVNVGFAFTKKKALSKKLKSTIDTHLKALKAEKDSVYYSTIDKWLGGTTRHKIPRWFFWLSIVLAALLITTIVISCLLKKIIEIRTSQIKKQYRQIEVMRNYLKAIYEATPDMLIIYNAFGQIIDMNSNTEKILGYERNELMKLNPIDIMGENTDIEKAKEYLERATNGEFLEFEWTIKKKDGKEIPVEVRMQRFFITKETGLKVPYVLTIVRDITEKKIAEERIRKSEEWFRTIFESEPECVKIVTLDGRLIDMNPAGLRMIGVDSVEKIRGHYIIQLVDDEYVETYLKAMEEAAKGNNITFEFKLKTPEGKTRWMESHATPLKDEHGKVTAILSVTRDITQRKLNQEELEKLVKQRTEHLQKLLNAMADREVRMAELKEVIKQLREQLIALGFTPVADDPLKEDIK